MRQLKVFQLQAAKKLYQQLVEQISEPEAKKKEAFKNCKHKKESLLTLVLMAVSQTSALQSLSTLILQTCSDYFRAKTQDKQAERKSELQMKHIQDET